MAWEELLQQKEGRVPREAEREAAAPRASESLILWICDDMPETARAETKADADDDEDPAMLADGYVRRTPVQVYKTAPGFHRKRVRNVIIAVVALFLIVLLVIALYKSGLIRMA